MKTLLHIGPNGLQYWQRSRGRWQLQTVANQGAVWAVTDLAEESLVEIQIPRIFGRDRSNFVARQLANRFPDTPFRTALPLSASGSLMDRLAPPRQLLLGVDAAQRIQTALDAQTAPLAGVWSSSMLLAQMGRNKQLPADLFIVMPGSASLRIVFLKHRQAVLARLAPASEQPAEQVAEIVRTLRHLENTHSVERSQRRYPVLVLGPTAGLGAALTAQGLDLVAAPAPWQHAPPHDWRFALFDLAVQSPSGQLAPIAARSAFLGRRLRRATYGAAAVSLGVTLWSVSGQLQGAMNAQHARDQVQPQLEHQQHELTRTEQSIISFGVAPELLRRAVKLDTQELVSAPALADSMKLVANIVSRSTRQHVSRFEWRLLPGAQPACAQTVPTPGSEAAASVAAALAAQHKVELSFDLALAAGTTARDRARTLTEISDGLALVKGATLIRDPARRFAQQTLTDGNRDDTQNVSSWCLVLAHADVSYPLAAGIAR